jgi:hypothetical protein
MARPLPADSQRVLRWRLSAVASGRRDLALQSCFLLPACCFILVCSGSTARGLTWRARRTRCRPHCSCDTSFTFLQLPLPKLGQHGVLKWLQVRRVARSAATAMPHAFLCCSRLLGKSNFPCQTSRWQRCLQFGLLCEPCKRFCAYAKCCCCCCCCCCCYLPLSSMCNDTLSQLSQLLAPPNDRMAASPLELSHVLPNQKRHFGFGNFVEVL